MNTPLRVAFDATATPLGLTGAGYYVTEIVRELASRDEIHLTVITRKSDEQRFTSIAPRARILNISPDATPARIAFQMFRLGKIVDSLDVDIFHGPHYQIPLKMKTPSVVTIHDMTLITHPDVHTWAKRFFFSRIIPRSICEAASIVSVSQHTADDIVRAYNDVDNIVIAPLGVDSERFSSVSDTEKDKEILKIRGIESPYIAYLGLIEPRKCIPTLVKAFARISHGHEDLTLVIAGGQGWGIKDARRAIANSGVATRIILTGRLDDDEVPPLLRNAEVFVYPSMYEGFGMPVIEAMACGTPTVTTQSSSLSEVAGDAALLVAPQDEKKLSEAIELLLNDEDLRKKLSSASIERAQTFTWPTCVDAHIEAYKKATA